MCQSFRGLCVPLAQAFDRRQTLTKTCWLFLYFFFRVLFFGWNEYLVWCDRCAGCWSCQCGLESDELSPIELYDLCVEFHPKFPGCRLAPVDPTSHPTNNQFQYHFRLPIALFISIENQSEQMIILASPVGDDSFENHSHCIRLRFPAQIRIIAVVSSTTICNHSNAMGWVLRAAQYGRYAIGDNPIERVLWMNQNCALVAATRMDDDEGFSEAQVVSFFITSWPYAWLPSRIFGGSSTLTQFQIEFFSHRNESNWTEIYWNSHRASERARAHVNGMFVHVIWLRRFWEIMPPHFTVLQSFEKSWDDSR